MSGISVERSVPWAMQVPGRATVWLGSAAAAAPLVSRRLPVRRSCHLDGHLRARAIRRGLCVTCMQCLCCASSISVLIVVSACIFFSFFLLPCIFFRWCASLSSHLFSYFSHTIAIFCPSMPSHVIVFFGKTCPRIFLLPSVILPPPLDELQLTAYFVKSVTALRAVALKSLVCSCPYILQRWMALLAV